VSLDYSAHCEGTHAPNTTVLGPAKRGFWPWYPRLEHFAVAT
jgi:hypothetical protein